MTERLLDASALTIPGLRLLQYGSAPIRPATLARAVSALPGVRFINMFGQTEGSPIACLVPEDHERALTGRPDLLASVGRAAPGVELRLENPDGNGVGEVLAKGDHLFKLAEDGWLHTSDLATMDDEGYVYLVGRLGDRIKRGGENVHPVEVEDVLRGHPAVLEVAVTGVPDAELGQSVRAFVVLNEDALNRIRKNCALSRAASSRASRCRRRGGSCRNSRGTPAERYCAGCSASRADRYRTLDMPGNLHLQFIS